MKTTGTFLGWFEFRPVEEHSTAVVELGYRLNQAAWGHGYATEGSRALIHKGFTDMEVERVTANTMAVNTRSRRVMEKSGLSFVRNFTGDWPEAIEGSEHGEIEYELTRTESAKPRVLVLCGGFAGLETAFALRRQVGERVGLTVVADQDSFLFKPNTIYIPFGRDEDSLRIPLPGTLARRRIALQERRVAEVDPDARAVGLTDETRLRYDFLVIATGAAMRPQEVPGLAEHAQTIWTPQQMRALGGHLRELESAVRAGRHRRVLFLVPPNNKCAGPLYEIVLMLDTWLRRSAVRDGVELTWPTYESGYIQAFGPRLHEVVKAEFARRDVHGHTDAVAVKVSEQEVAYTDGTIRPFDLLVSFPPYVAAVDYPALARDDRGFLTTEPSTRRLVGHPEIYAPGDAGDFPVKQAFLAFLQADAVADDLAAVIAPSTSRLPKPFVPTSMCVMETLDSATFAQVPLELSGDPAHPVRVARGAGGAYRVGTSPLWRLGKKALGVYLPVQFRAGRPFHQGLPWRAMQLALDGMSRVLAAGPSN